MDSDPDTITHGRRASDTAAAVEGLQVVVEKNLIALVRKNVDFALRRQLADLKEFRGRDHGAGRIARGVEDDEFRPLCDMPLNQVTADGKILFGRGFNNNRFSAAQVDYLGKGHPVRSGNDYLVVRIDQCQNRVKDRMLAPDGRDHFFSFSLYAEVLAISTQDRIAQLSHADRRSVAGEICVDGPLGSFLDILRRIEVRLSRSKIHDLHPFGLELLRCNHDLHGRGFLHVLEALGKQALGSN